MRCIEVAHLLFSLFSFSPRIFFVMFKLSIVLPKLLSWYVCSVASGNAGDIATALSDQPHNANVVGGTGGNKLDVTQAARGRCSRSVGLCLCCM